ncbi:MAG: arsenite methyltransferase [Planctomycetes bacterium]|nr:arsenite methyltransferase [Planctomycetota bacterium]
MSDTKNPNDVRDQVSRAYATALKASEEGGSCCGSKKTVPAGMAAKLAGYEAELDSVPEGAAKSSFGCGNPLAFAEVEEGQTVLDLGSGAGLDLLLARQKVGASGKVIGVDMTDEMIEAARRNVTEAGYDNVELRKGVIEALPVEDASVDLLISNCVINLSPDKPAVFREIARVLKPGGRVSVSDIVAEELPQWVREHAAAYSACIGGAISEQEYVAGLEAAGLTEVEVSERLVYDECQLQGVVGSDLDALGVPREQLEAGVAAVVGKVWSAKFQARKS